MYLGQRRWHVSNIFEHLDRQRRVERFVSDGQASGIRPMEYHVVVAHGPLGCNGQHRGRDVDTHYRSPWSDTLEQLGNIEPRTAANVKYTLTGLRVECVVNKTAAPQHITSAIEDFEGLSEILVEFELRHLPQATRACLPRPDH